MNELNVTGLDTMKVVPALASVDVTANLTDALEDGWRERGEERVMGDASEEKVPSAISSVDAEEEWVSATWSVIHGISLHPHVENALPDGDAYVIVCVPSLGVKRRCWRSIRDEEEYSAL